MAAMGEKMPNTKNELVVWTSRQAMSHDRELPVLLHAMPYSWVVAQWARLKIPAENAESPWSNQIQNRAGRRSSTQSALYAMGTVG